MVCYMSMQPGRLGERLIQGVKPVPIANQRMVTTYDHEKMKFQPNPSYGRFRAPGLKWEGAPSISGTKLALERDQMIANSKKRSRDEGAGSDTAAFTEGAPNPPPRGPLSKAVKATTRISKLQIKKKVLGPNPKPAWK